MRLLPLIALLIPVAAFAQTVPPDRVQPPIQRQQPPAPDQRALQMMLNRELGTHQADLADAFKISAENTALKLRLAEVQAQLAAMKPASEAKAPDAPAEK